MISSEVGKELETLANNCVAMMTKCGIGTNAARLCQDASELLTQARTDVLGRPAAAGEPPIPKPGESAEAHHRRVVAEMDRVHQKKMSIVNARG